MMTEIQAIEGGQKDALLTRANIKKKLKKLSNKLKTHDKKEFDKCLNSEATKCWSKYTRITKNVLKVT